MSRTMLALASASLMLVAGGCERRSGHPKAVLLPPITPSYYDNTNHPDAWSGG